MSALDIQEGGCHYKELKIQPIEYIHANSLDFFQGNIIKYATRHKSKHGVEDLKKVIHYAQLAIELQYGVKPEQEPSDDGWIAWGGGECPVEALTSIDVRYRDGQVKLGIAAMAPLPGRDATADYWVNDGNLPNDIIAYRISIAKTAPAVA